MHNKFGQRLPFAVWALLGGLVLLAVLGYVLKDRLSTRFAPLASTAEATTTPSSQTAAAPRPVAAAAPATSSPPWPWYEAVSIKQDRELLSGRAIQMEDGYSINGQPHYTFGVVIEGEGVARLTGEQLAAMEYYYA